MEERDRRRWDTADEDKDGHLNKFEFKHFLHPEEADHMRDVVISETVDDIDKDGDGKISLAEYIGDMYRQVQGDPNQNLLIQMAITLKMCLYLFLEIVNKQLKN